MVKSKTKKEKIDKVLEEPQTPPKRKRGRPRKNQQVHPAVTKPKQQNKKVKEVKNTKDKKEVEDEIILHIPFTMVDLKDLTTIDDNGSEASKKIHQRKMHKIQMYLL